MVRGARWDRRRLLGTIAAAPVWMAAGCRSDSTSISTPRRYSERPDMMAIGDSLYQGVRSLSFAPGMPVLSPPAQIAAALGIKRFTVPDLGRPLLFDLERLFTTPVPLVLAALLEFAVNVSSNAAGWTLPLPWSAHEAFDNISIGGAAIENLWNDRDAHSRPIFFSNVRDPHFDDSTILFKTWYALAVSYTLNPLGRDEQAGRSPLDQVADRKPKILLVNIGSNEGLFNGAFTGNVPENDASLKASIGRMDELARRLGELPREVETVVFNSILRPRAVPNLMPATGATARPPGDGYYDAYGPWLLRGDQPLPGSVVAGFDRTVSDYNGQTRSLLERSLGKRLVYVDLFTACSEFDGKHYAGRGTRVGTETLANVPLTLVDGKRSGGLTGLDNMHPTGVGYAQISDIVLRTMGSLAVTSKEAAFSGDSLLTHLPLLIDARQQEIRELYALLGRIGSAGIASTAEQRAATQA